MVSLAGGAAMRHEPPHRYRQRSSADRVRADRQRHYRQRQSAGKLIVRIEIDEIETAQILSKRGFLDTGGADDRRAVEAAMQRMIDALVAAERDA